MQTPGQAHFWHPQVESRADSMGVTIQVHRPRYAPAAQTPRDVGARLGDRPGQPSGQDCLRWQREVPGRLLDREGLRPRRGAQAGWRGAGGLLSEARRAAQRGWSACRLRGQPRSPGSSTARPGRLLLDTRRRAPRRPRRRHEHAWTPLRGDDIRSVRVWACGDARIVTSANRIVGQRLAPYRHEKTDASIIASE
jgi:hypothetical protein